MNMRAATSPKVQARGSGPSANPPRDQHGSHDQSWTAVVALDGLSEQP